MRIPLILFFATLSITIISSACPVVAGSRMGAENDAFSVLVERHTGYPDYAVYLSILDKDLGGTGRIVVKEHFHSVDELRIIGIDTLCVIGELLPGYGHIISVVDLRSLEVRDTIWTSRTFAFSNLDRYLAFMRFVPKFTPPGFTPPILLYDLRKSPLENRFGHSDLDEKENLGLPVFPHENLTSRAYSPLLAEERYGYTSPILWADDDSRFLFIAVRGPAGGPYTNLLVTAIYRHDEQAWNLSEMPINLQSLVNLDRLAFREDRQKIAAGTYPLSVRDMRWVEFPREILLDTFYLGELRLAIR
jgi:hypothetical protein